VKNLSRTRDFRGKFFSALGRFKNSFNFRRGFLPVRLNERLNSAAFTSQPAAQALERPID
jgi:hypothetical protein